MPRAIHTVRQKLLDAVQHHFEATGHGATLVELARFTRTKQSTAYNTMRSLRSTKAVDIGGWRKSPHCIKQVAEYVPAGAANKAASLDACVRSWVQAA